MPPCSSGKRAYDRRRQAKRALRQIQSNPGMVVRSVYQCPECGRYHLTHHGRKVNQTWPKPSERST